MALVAAVSTLLFIAVGAVTGLRLLALARRTRGLPETTLGLGLFLIVGVGYPLALASTELRGAWFASRILPAVGMAVLSIGWSSVWVFTWRVFRPASRVATAASGTAIAALLGLGSWRAVQFLSTAPVPEAGAVDPLSTAIQSIALVVYVWTSVESLSYWWRLRKRLALGLADPIVANRLLLWGIVGIFSFVSLMGPIYSTAVGASPAEVPLIRFSTAVAGLACSGALYLAFLPPAAYVRRFAARPAPEF